MRSILILITAALSLTLGGCATLAAGLVGMDQGIQRGNANRQPSYNCSHNTLGDYDCRANPY